MAVYPRSAVCVTVVGFTLHHDTRLVPTAAGHIASFTSANYLCKVFLSAEQDLNILVQTSSAIETGIDDDTFTVIVLAQNIRINGTEAVISHGFNVHISQTAVRPFVYIGCPLFYPACIEQIAHYTIADRNNYFFPTFFGLRVIERNQCFLSGFTVQQNRVIAFGSDFLTVDLFNDISGLHFGTGVVEGAFFHYFRNQQTFAVMIPVIQ